LDAGNYAGFRYVEIAEASFDAEFCYRAPAPVTLALELATETESFRRELRMPAAKEFRRASRPVSARIGKFEARISLAENAECELAWFRFGKAAAAAEKTGTPEDAEKEAVRTP
jgi:hypothetical protein